MERSRLRTGLALAVALLAGPEPGAAQRRPVALVVPGPEPADRQVPITPAPTPPAEPGRMMYTTYFYTAGEAVIQGYERDTHARVFVLGTNEPIYAGTVGEGESVLVPTGAGVFGFVSDKKAAILVGTPSSCAVVGYWGRDREGSFVSSRHLVRLPSTSHYDDDRVLVWATEQSHVVIRDQTTGHTIWEGDLPARGRYEIPHARLTELGSHTLDVRSNAASVLVQVYYDEGFTVPSLNGRAVGREFLTYVGRTTEGQNDLVLTSYHGDARVRVTDLTTERVLFTGTVREAAVHAMTLQQTFVRVESDREIAVSVVPYAHYAGAYAEHHFSSGAEGTGIDTEFIVTSPNDLWIFSYFGNNEITVESMTTHERIFRGTLAAGGSHGLSPGHGLYRVRATRGASVMGGAQSCGGEYSPAGRLFAVDDAVMQAVTRVLEQRREQAAARGVTLTPEAAAAPLTTQEMQQVTGEVQRATRSRAYDAAAVQERVEAVRAR